MIDLLFILIFLSFPAAIFYLMTVSDLSPFRFSVPSFVMLSMFVFAYAGILPLYFGWDEYRFITGIQDQSIILKMFFFSSWSIFAMVIGFVYSKNIFGLKGHFHSLGLIRSLSGKERFVVFTLFLICLGVLALFISKLTSIALFVALANEEGLRESGVARSLMGNAFPGKYHWYKVFMHEALNFVTFTLFANWLVKRGKVNLFLFLVALLSASFSAVMAIEKGPFAWLLIGLFLVYASVLYSGKYPLKSFFKLSLVLLGFLSVFYIYFMGSSNVGTAVQSIFSRAFTGGIAPAYHYLEYFPGNHDFLIGRSFPNPGGIMPFESYNLTVEVSNLMYPENAGKEIVGSAPTVFWAEMYANFGVFGVLFAPFIVGIALYVMAELLNKLENTPIKVGLIVWFALHFKNLSETSLSGFIMDTYLIIILGLVVSITLVSNNGKFKIFKKVPF